MKISEIIKASGKIVAFEFSPPATPQEESGLMNCIQKLSVYSPSFISVSHHIGPGSLGRVMHITKVLAGENVHTVMPHITCIEPGRKGLPALLDFYRELGIENIFAVRGDVLEYGEGAFDDGEHYRYAADLVGQIAGYDAFCIGVAVYPEGHPESPNPGVDTSYTKMKIDRGAKFAVSQFFFDNFYFYEMMDRFIQDGINIPVIAGIMPITDYQEIEQYAEQSGIEIPVTITARFEELDDPADVIKAGIDFATEQCLDLWENGIRHFYFQTFNRHDAVSSILDNLADAFTQNAQAG